jgi:hypothetical protein
LCGIYDQIIGQPTAEFSPAFGAGCCSSMNTDRAVVMSKEQEFLRI